MDTQENILLSLIQGQEGRAWAMEKKGWKPNDSISVCEWDHILCDSYGTTVTRIRMSETDFIGSLPTELGNLLTLEEIAMRRNLVIGTIPQEIANLPHLEKLFLAQNRITGTVPTFVSPKITTIDLAYNLLSGTLDPDFAISNVKLAELDLSYNKIKGTIPTSLGASDKLITLSLSENQLSGTIHDFLGSKPSIAYLYLDGNSFMGTIPSSFSGGSSGLQELWLHNNLLTGTIPSEIGELSDLFNFYVDGNKFTGTIPQSLCRPDLNKDFFENVPASESRDYCESVACPPGEVSFEGVYPCQKCADTFFNPYLGRVNQCIDLDEVQILKVLYEKTGGYLWIDASWNNFQEDMYCDLDGIVCGNHGNIIAINLKGKGLRGTIPEEIGFLRYLEQLDLSDNYLTGPLPSDLRWAPLQYLDVSGNELRGIIPQVLCGKEGVNGNGNNGKFDCDFIQCSPGFYSREGRATETQKCRPCLTGKGTAFIGSKKCVTLFGHLNPDPFTQRSVSSQVISYLFVLAFLSMICGLGYCYYDGSSYKMLQNDNKDEEEEVETYNKRLSETVVLS